MTPRNNPDCSDVKRDRRLKAKVLEEISDAEDIWRNTGAETLPERVRDYIDRKSMSDHISFYTLVSVIYGRKPAPRTKAEKFDFNELRDRISGLIGGVKDNSESISIGRALHQDGDGKGETTGDLEFVVFNADKERELDQLKVRTGRYTSTMIRRVEKTVANVLKPKRVRKKIMRKEQIAPIER